MSRAEQLIEQYICEESFEAHFLNKTDYEGAVQALNALRARGLIGLVTYNQQKLLIILARIHLSDDRVRAILDTHHAHYALP